MDSNSDEDEVPQLPRPRRSPRKKQRTDPFGEEDNDDKIEVSTVSVVTPDQALVGKEDDDELFSSDEEGEKTDVNLFGNENDEDLFSEDEEGQEEQATTPVEENGVFRMPPKHSTRYVASKNTCELHDTVEVVKECNDAFMLRELFPGKVCIAMLNIKCQILSSNFNNIE